MKILYVCDNEITSVMDLETLIHNFNDSEAWEHMPVTEPDIRFDVVDGRGWCASHHDNGHFLILNLEDSRIGQLVMERPFEQTPFRDEGSALGQCAHRWRFDADNIETCADCGVERGENR